MIAAFAAILTLAGPLFWTGVAPSCDHAWEMLHETLAEWAEHSPVVVDWRCDDESPVEGIVVEAQSRLKYRHGETAFYAPTVIYEPHEGEVE